MIVKTDCETDGALHSTSSEQGGRGEVSGHCIPQIIVTFVSTPAPAPAPAAAASTFLEPAGRGGWGGGHHISHTQYTPVLTCTPVHTV